MELDSGADSVSSTPRSVPNSDDKSVVRLMVSFGGKILPRPHDNQLRYVGGDTRIVAVNRSTSFSLLLSKLSKLLSPQNSSSSSAVDFTVKYQLPNEELDALITVSTDEDVENMMEEFDRLSISSSNRIPRLRLFLFPAVNGEEVSRTSSIASLLDGSRKRENWFLDALNGGSSGGLERGRSEASSIVSEVPDYLFGLDNSDEPPLPPPKLRNRYGLNEPAPGSDPGSPAFGSSSSVPAMPNLPPVKTKVPDKANLNPVEDGIEPAVQQVGGPVWSHNVNPGSPFPAHAVQPVPVYYVPAAGSGPGLVAQRNMIPVPQVGGPVWSPIFEIPIQGNMVQGQGLGGMNQPLYYGVNNGGMVSNFPGSGMPMAGNEDGSRGRNLQG